VHLGVFGYDFIKGLVNSVAFESIRTEFGQIKLFCAAAFLTAIS
jgi:hypothetical protein